MKRVILNLVVVITLLAVATFYLIRRFDLLGVSTQNKIAAIPTFTPIPGPPLTNVTDAPSPPITTTDGCVAVQSADGDSLSATEQRAKRNNQGRGQRGKEVRQPNLPNRPVQNQVLIRFTEESSQQERNAYIRSINGRSRRNIDKLNTFVVVVPDDTDMANLPTSPFVEYIEPDYIIGAAQTNDPLVSDQWALPVVGASLAWDALPDDDAVTIAVLDSGICANHPDLIGRVGTGFDFVQDDNNPEDEFGHGCGVAGVIASNMNNAQGIAGIAPNAQIMPIRVLDAQGLGSYSNVAAGIVYAVDNGAKVINLSLAGTNFSQALSDAIVYAVDNDVTIVASAGNYGSDAVYYPASLSTVIGVGSIDENLQRSSFSNYGINANVYAPGRDILTTNMAGSYDIQTGTSFAAPIVAGLVAMGEQFELPLNVEGGIVYLYPPENLPDCTDEDE